MALHGSVALTTGQLVLSTTSLWKIMLLYGNMWDGGGGRLVKKSVKQHESENFQRPDKLHLIDLICTGWQKKKKKKKLEWSPVAPCTLLDRYTLVTPTSTNQVYDS